jgi:sulfur-carrier protein adenylyltransferase/sulfurtransferase
MSEKNNYAESLKKMIPEISPENLKLDSNSILLDCREQEEVEMGIIHSAHWIPKGQVDLVFEEKFPNKNSPIVVYCASGFRSLFVAKYLMDLGFIDVSSLKGGIQGWKNSGFEIESFEKVTTLNKKRYLSQLRVPEIGEKGQKQIQQGRVLIVGAGGLGSPVALYLGAAGVGTIGIVDADVVDESNLQRQLLHNTDRIGLKKVDSAFLTLKNLNPLLNVKTYSQRLSAENIDQIIAEYDVVVDGCDNFNTRYLINLACIKNKKINVHGSVLRFHGQVAVFGIESTACYSCVFAEPPSSDLEIDCAQGGVIGATAGVVGSLMSIEVLKIILNVGTLAANRLIVYDGLRCEFDELKIAKSDDCPVCSVDKSLLNYQNLENYLKQCKIN